MRKQSLRMRLQCSAAAAILATAMGSYAAAQDTDDDEEPTDRLQVTGIRASIETSLEAKRENTSIVEAITAEDIGKLPDLSIADSLARLPGVTAQRVRGRAQQISIRGLGPDFSLALLNGREVVSAGNNRGIEFDQFPSELINQGLVYKTPDARLAATGIAGAVDLRTVRPLDFDSRQINLSARYVFNDQDQLNPDFNDDGYRFFGSLIDQNEAGTLGWSLGLTVQSNPTQFTSRELKTGDFQTAVDATTGAVFPRDNPRTGSVSREFERTSVTGALQFEPNDTFQATLDAFYTDTEDSGIFRGVETPIASWAGVGDDEVSVVGQSGQFAQSASYSGVGPILRTDTEGNEAEIFAIGLNTSWSATDQLLFTADISRSELDRNDIDYESYAGRGGNILGGRDPSLLDDLTFGFDRDGEYTVGSSADYTDPNQVFLTDPGGWGQVGFLKRPKIEDELTQLRFEAEYTLNNTPFISSVATGVIYSDREKNFDSNEDFLRNNESWSAPDGSTNNSERFLAIPNVIGATDDGGTGLPIIAYDPTSFLTDGTYTVEKATFDTEWTVGEEILTYYAMANIDGMLGQTPVRGNVGFQYVDTEQSSTGTLSGQGEQTLDESYGDFLPSANLSFEVVPDTFVRIAAARTLTRARLDQLAANQTLGINPTVCADGDGDGAADAFTGQQPINLGNGTTCYTLGGGNPSLEPYRSTSFDLSFEKYFGSTTAISVAFFHKDLEDWVVDTSQLIDGTQFIEGAGGGDFLAANPDVGAVRLNAPINFAEGTITGIELTANASLDPLLPPQLAGFGVFASYTYADNELDAGNNAFGEEVDPNTGGPVPGTSAIPGYSDTVWSGNIYYENYGWRARLSGRYRSEFLSEIQLFDGGLAGSQAEEELVLDAQIGYEWDRGPLEGFTILFEAFNITDEPFTTVDSDSQTGDVLFPSRHELYGTTYNIALSKKF